MGKMEKKCAMQQTLRLVHL